ncbi:GSU3529 family protein [Trichlorobacter ammonificans]|uniref:Uncharacterized protein n=1 Tax=Trichlorobacter ammonificans TaxID=2916410 RepID=A0ABM9DBF6_9BACT|nr:hypothetical protein [Trichlorobacter ammonificans]CAH2032560.1 conserved protein of unknown function [Trichlorobacter ammonificans]
MDVFEQLRRVTEQAQAENDLPDVLAARLFRIVERPELFDRYRGEIADLAGQVEQYDTYAQTGYMGMGVNNVILDGAIRRMEEKASLPP